MGQRAGVGCFVDSCRACDKCTGAGEQYCAKAVYTYNSVHHDGTPAQGGYSTHITIHEYYAVSLQCLMSVHSKINGPFDRTPAEGGYSMRMTVQSALVLLLLLL